MQQGSTETQSTKPSEGQSEKSKSKPKSKRTPKKNHTAEKSDAKKPRRKKEASKGFGDTIQKITEATKLDALAKAIAGEDCGCDERRKKLNALFPYAQPMSEQSKRKWEEVIEPAWGRNTLKRPDQLALTEVWLQVFGKRKHFTSCASCLTKALKQLKKAYDNSCDKDA